MHGPRALFLAAIASAWALLVSSVSALAADLAWPDSAVVRILTTVLAIVATGFFFFVKKWIAQREANDRAVMDTLRAHIEKQDLFERHVEWNIGQIMGHLGLHREDSDPEIHVRQGERRQQAERRILRPDGRET